MEHHSVQLHSAQRVASHAADAVTSKLEITRSFMFFWGGMHA